MKILTITGLLFSITLICAAQSSEIKYYKSSSMDEEVPQEKAKYSRTITNNPDGSVTTERKNLKKNLIESRQVLKGEEPVGIWVYLTGRGPAEMDYNFNIEYSNQDCSNNLNIKNYFTEEITVAYESPKISTGEQFHEFLGKNLVYPAKARREGIQGKVDLTFDLTKDGIIENIRVRKGVHVVLDKEAVRILRKIKLSSPPKINGQPRICVLKHQFRLDWLENKFLQPLTKAKRNCGLGGGKDVFNTLFKFIDMGSDASSKTTIAFSKTL